MSGISAAGTGRVDPLPIGGHGASLGCRAPVGRRGRTEATKKPAPRREQAGGSRMRATSPGRSPGADEIEITDWRREASVLRIIMYCNAFVEPSLVNRLVRAIRRVLTALTASSHCRSAVVSLVRRINSLRSSPDSMSLGLISSSSSLASCLPSLSVSQRVRGVPDEQHENVSLHESPAPRTRGPRRFLFAFDAEGRLWQPRTS